MGLNMARLRRNRTPRALAAAARSFDQLIVTIRNERVIVDSDLARIYGVETRVLKQAVRRNRDKFPPDFLCELTLSEADELRRTLSRSQIVILNRGENIKHRPFAFTEHGAIMAANILNSPRAVQMSVFVVRAFIKMRAAFTDTRELARKLVSLEEELKARLDTHEGAIVDVLQRIMVLLDPPPPPPARPAREMGFHAVLKTGSSKKS